MSAVTLAQGATWAIAAAAAGGVIGRPWRLPEAVCAVLGAGTLVALALVPWRDALAAIGRGTDVYLFLAGMMLLAELARREGVFDWLAAFAARRARGSASRLFALVFAVGTVVTALLSNDATAVVLTPAVYAAAKTAKAPPLPYLFVCAFVANAASFVLPISNPANLVLFGGDMPPLPAWLGMFAVPSILAIGPTFLVLRWVQRGALRQPISSQIPLPVLSGYGVVDPGGISFAAVVLVTASAWGLRLGLPTAVAGALTTLTVLLCQRQMPAALIKSISWSVLPLVAGLFVLVEGLVCTGVIGQLSRTLQLAAASAPAATAAAAGTITAVACNLVNNLPVGLVAGSAVAAAAPVPPVVAGALLVGVDLGPNLSVTGSLATILWLVALRREGLEVGAWQFLRIGVIVTAPALLLALAGLVAMNLN
jgi:arsenical pump membrane protein